MAWWGVASTCSALMPSALPTMTNVMSGQASNCRERRRHEWHAGPAGGVVAPSDGEVGAGSCQRQGDAAAEPAGGVCPAAVFSADLTRTIRRSVGGGSQRNGRDHRHSG
jgi:hypothetical protein